VKYTTIRITVEDRDRLKRLAKLLETGKIIDALRYAITVAEKELSKYRGNPAAILETLKHARDIGETNAEEVEKYLYGEET